MKGRDGGRDRGSWLPAGWRGYVELGVVATLTGSVCMAGAAATLENPQAAVVFIRAGDWLMNPGSWPLSDGGNAMAFYVWTGGMLGAALAIVVPLDVWYRRGLGAEGRPGTGSAKEGRG